MKWLLALPLVAAIVVAASAASAPEHGWRAVEIEIVIAKAAALFGCLVAALTFRSWHYLHRAWRWMAALFVFLLWRDAILHKQFLRGVEPAVSEWVQAGLVLAANVCGVAGVWMLSRAWRIADLDLPGGKRVHRAVGGIALAIAVTITAPSLSLHFQELVDGKVIALVGIASTLGDAIQLALIAPLLLTALALRGQPVGWPWMIFTIGALCFLAFDATIALANFGSGHATLRRGVAEVFRAAACFSFAAAGIAQRLSAAKAPAWTVGIAR
jgi:hypothetical protein